MVPPHMLKGYLEEPLVEVALRLWRQLHNEAHKTARILAPPFPFPSRETISSIHRGYVPYRGIPSSSENAVKANFGELSFQAFRRIDPFRCVGLLWMASCSQLRVEEMMNAPVVYDSQYGNTERIAQTIADTLAEFGEARTLRLDPAHPLEFQGVDMLIVGCPTQGWRPTPPIQSFLEEVPSEELRSLAVACFDTRFRLPRWMSGSAARVMARKLKEKGGSLLVPPESFFVKGTEGPLRCAEVERASTWARTPLEKVPPPAEQ